MNEQLLQVGVGGALALLILREVLRFLSKRTDEIYMLRKEVNAQMAIITAESRAQQADIAALLAKLQSQQDREQRFWDRDWPQLTQTVNSHNRRITHLEIGHAEVRAHVGLSSGQTPPMGVPIIIKED